MHVTGWMGGDKVKMNLAVEFWWRIERLAGFLWELACPDDRVECWLDWLPAWAYTKRKRAERRQWQKA